MPYASGKILVSWSGGKDSALALKNLLKDREFEVAGLLTAIRSSDGRVPQNYISREMISLQAESLGLPVDFIHIPDKCDQMSYRSKFLEALKTYKNQGIRHIAFGDLFLDDIRDFREDCFGKIGFECEFPLWQRCTKELALSFVNSKFKAVITSVDRNTLSEDLLCRTFDKSFLSDLPVNVDPCGENGEFHTFVFAGPIFKTPLSVKSGDVVQDGNLSFCDIITKEINPTKLAAAMS